VRGLGEITMAELEISGLTQENLYKCIHLKLGEGQGNLIAPNVYSIAESKVNLCFTPYAINLDKEVIGFVMVDYDPTLDEKNKYWIPRFMIDIRYQAKGHGKEAMKKIINTLSANEDCSFIRLSTGPENIPAIKFYESLGFRNTGEFLEEEEIILELEV
jgi:diamine N-acetyltransferase